MGVRLAVRSAWSRRPTEDVVYEFDQARIVIGRGAGTDVRLPHRAVSETHATLRVHGTGYAVVDESSTNGTRVNGASVAPGRPKLLRTGDLIELGGFEIGFTAGVPVADATSADRTAALARRLVREALAANGQEPAPPRLVVLNGPDEGRTFDLPPPPARLVVGRGEEADLVLSDADASREHVELVRDLDGVIARDLGSKNGLLVNDRPVDERRLRDRDELLVGATVLAFEEPADSALHELGEAPDLPSDALPSPPALADLVATSDEDTDGPARRTPAAQTPEASTPSSPSSEGPVAAPADGTPRGGTARERTPPERRPKRGALGADVIIYVLAAVVLALSVAGLIILLRAG